MDGLGLELTEAMKRKMTSALTQFNLANKGVKVSAVISTDGYVLGIRMANQSNMDRDRFGAMSASMLALARRQAAESESGKLRMLLIDGTEGAVLQIYASDSIVFSVTLEPRVNLGMIFLEAKKMALTLKEIYEAKTP